MATLIIHQGQQTIPVDFDAPVPLSQLLARTDAALAQPCGGRGVCGKCAVTLTGSVSAPNAAEHTLGVRLACQAVITGDAEVILPAKHRISQIEGGRSTDLVSLSPMPGRYGAAVDIGSTTIALLLYELSTGRCLGSSGMLNPQTNISADVIGRINAAINGRAAELQQQAESAVRTLLVSSCAQANIPPEEVDALVVTGNTTMLYLITGRAPTSLSRAPFQADCLFGNAAMVLGRSAYLPDCLHAFVGADTTCAILSSGMMRTDVTSLLCDVGTNGELALWHHGRLYIASTAAGPAFEGAGIRHGCSSISGAIDQVTAENGVLISHTINDAPAVGICGSGLVDAIAAMLDAGILDDTGYLEDEEYPLRDGIALTQGDIRAIQLAKAAIYAGMMTLLSAAECTTDEVTMLYLAGGFGSHLNIRSAVRIGLIPAELSDRVQVIGNAALDGAALLLTDTSLLQQTLTMRTLAQHVRLDGNPEFSDRYIDAMMFPEE